MGIGEHLLDQQNNSDAAYRPPHLTIEELENFGFKEYPRAESNKERWDRNWQYCLRDKKGKKLFVEVRLWCFSRYSRPDNIVYDTFDAECQFDMHGAKTFNVTINVNDMTPQQIVEWFENMHTKMNCVYYELYDYDTESVPNACGKCRRYLSPDDAVQPYLCPICKYEYDTGFKKC
jgi:hypothetical protein